METHDIYIHKHKTVLIHGYRLKLTCFACPECWEIYDSESIQVGYLRLRHGTCTVHFPDYGGEMIYSAYTIGDGIFDPDERMLHLRKAVEAIQNETVNVIFSALDYDKD